MLAPYRALRRDSLCHFHLHALLQNRASPRLLRKRVPPPGICDKRNGVQRSVCEAAMRRSTITWTPQLLDEFIADPQKLVPANRMPYSGMPNAADRADLIAYLQKATK